MKNKTSNRLIGGAVLLLAAVFGSLAYSHCQVPCGIYDDEARLAAIAEHITTIEKAMKEIESLSAQPNMNQIVRWVNNKDQHADELSEIVTYYFMAQRIKVASESDTKAYADYVRKLTLLHQMVVRSMQAKQTTDLAHVQELRSLLEQFRTAYSGKAG